MDQYIPQEEVRRIIISDMVKKRNSIVPNPYSTKKYTFIHPVGYGLDSLEDVPLPYDAKFSFKKRGSFTQFPIFYVPDLLLSQEKIGTFIKTLKKIYTPATKIFLWPLVIIYILGIIISIVIILYNRSQL